MFGKKIRIKSPMKGKIIPLAKVKDEAFSSEVLGKGIAVLPETGTVVSPVNGTVDSVADAKHAVNLVGEAGEEIMIHVGMDTVTLKGKPFTARVKAGDKVKIGDVLLEVDLKAIKDAGLETVTPVVLLNTMDFKGLEYVSGEVKSGDLLFTITV
jgi:PTS system beta-glucosides-specific IIC component